MSCLYNFSEFHDTSVFEDSSSIHFWFLLEFQDLGLHIQGPHLGYVTSILDKLWPNSLSPAYQKTDTSSYPTNLLDCPHCKCLQFLCKEFKTISECVKTYPAWPQTSQSTDYKIVTRYAAARIIPDVPDRMSDVWLSNQTIWYGNLLINYVP